MKAIVDQSLCIGCGLCETTCPDVFRMNDDGVAEAYQEFSADLKDTVDEAVDGCPVGAISVES